MATKTLASGGTVSWLSNTSWSPSGVPTAADDVVLSAGMSVVLDGSAAVGTVLVNDGAALTVAAGASLTANGGITVVGGTVVISGVLSNTTLHVLSGSVTGGGTLSNVTIDGTDTLAAGNTLVLQGTTRFSNANEAGIVATAASTTIEVPTIIAGPQAASAVVDGGLFVVGSGNAAAPTRFLLHGSSLVFGAQSFLDIVGQTTLTSGGADAGFTGTYVNQGTILVGAGGRLTLSSTLVNSGEVHIASGTLDASSTGSYSGSGGIVFDDTHGTLIVGTSGTYTVKGFRGGNSISLLGIAPESITSANYSVTPSGTTFSYGSLTISLPGAVPNTTYVAKPDGKGGTILQTTSSGPAAPTYTVTANDASSTAYTVTRAGDLSTASVLAYSVTGDGINPLAATDFAGNVLPSGFVTFAGGASTATITLARSGTPPQTDQSFNLTVNGPGVSTPPIVGTVTAGAPVIPPVVPPVAPPVTPPVPPPVSYGLIGFSDATTGESGVRPLEAPGEGGPSYLQAQYIYAGSDSLALSTSVANVFVHSGSGSDAIAVTSGQNVLDGGLGSNYMTGGSGNDTFFTDARAPGVVWNTLINFHSGDQATLFGYTAGISSYHWEANVAGAPGAQGATLRANIVGGSGRTGDGIDASITFAGISVADAQKLQIVTGTVAAGNYLFIYSP